MKDPSVSKNISAATWSKANHWFQARGFHYDLTHRCWFRNWPWMSQVNSQTHCLSVTEEGYIVLRGGGGEKFTFPGKSDLSHLPDLWRLLTEDWLPC